MAASFLMCLHLETRAHIYREDCKSGMLAVDGLFFFAFFFPPSLFSFLLEERKRTREGASKKSREMQVFFLLGPIFFTRSRTRAFFRIALVQMEGENTGAAYTRREFQAGSVAFRYIL